MFLIFLDKWQDLLSTLKSFIHIYIANLSIDHTPLDSPYIFMVGKVYAYLELELKMSDLKRDVRWGQELLLVTL